MALQAPSKKKITYPVRADLEQYLEQYHRSVSLPLHYEDLLRHTNSLPLMDSDGNDTLWETVFYQESDRLDLYEGLKMIYALLKTDGDVGVIKHLTIARIDFCTFGNTHPFRVRIINRLNDNYDHFYIKKADASRIYGLELEDLLSPNRINYLVDNRTLVEEHIAGVPGDTFMETLGNESVLNQTRIAKEFVKFNERCFVRLLGDMRAYNFVVDITPDIEGSQYRLRAIDFDQQSYEGWKSFYLPQYFKENNTIIFIGIKHMRPETVKQYQLEERTLIATRVKASGERLEELLDVMVKDNISKPEKIAQLKHELGDHHHTNKFEKCQTMGQIVRTNIHLVVEKAFKQSDIASEITEKH